jgi:hypothetical protein
MDQHTFVDAADGFRRAGTAQRTRTLAPVVPSQDATRYQALDMPRPTYDLERPTERPSPGMTLRILVLTLVAAVAAIALIQRVGAWLSR